MKICGWCGIRLHNWRRLFASYCLNCAPRMKGDAGIYLKSSGPRYSYMSRLPGVRRG